MKNVTISISDDAYRAARIYAAEQDTSVTALVRNIILNLRAEHERFERLLRLERETADAIKGFTAGRIDRNALHERK